MSLVRVFCVAVLLFSQADCGEVLSLTGSSTCRNFTVDLEYNPLSPKVLCCLVPDEFIICEDPVQLNSSFEEDGGCSKFGGEFYEDVENATVNCSVVEGVVCAGETSFTKQDVPCLRYRGYYFPTIMLYSVFLGLFGVDRFCLGHTVLGIVKLLTLGGVGVWWVVDIILLLTGTTKPSNGYSWEQFR